MADKPKIRGMIAAALRAAADIIDASPEEVDDVTVSQTETIADDVIAEVEPEVVAAAIDVVAAAEVVEEKHEEIDSAYNELDAANEDYDARLKAALAILKGGK